MRRPTQEQLIEALGNLLDAYATIDEMLDSFASCGPEGMTAPERKRQRTSNNTRNKIQRLYTRARAA
jgi:hypothetical protein